MTENQPPELSKAEQRHRQIVEQYPLYKETAHWTPVIIPPRNQTDLEEWFNERSLKRGDKESRNDWLCPIRDFFLFKDPKVAMEFKLTWG